MKLVHSAEAIKPLDELYQDAIQEGGKFVFYHGGDTPDLQNQLKSMLKTAFPQIDLTIVVDYSKYHNVCIDNQLETDTLVLDVVALQTLQDFLRWKNEGQLLNYKPTNFSQIYDGYKDQDGAWFGYRLIIFSYVTGAAGLSGLSAPKTSMEIVDPKYKGLIASSYPHDDDAALFIFASYVEKYGWEWAAKLSTQSVSFNRGSHIAMMHVNQGQSSIGIATSASAVPAITSKYPFWAWAPRITIFKTVKHPAAAKLLLNWLTTEDIQRELSLTDWSVRKGIPIANGYKSLLDIPEASVAKFASFMRDRERVEQWKQSFVLCFGEMRGEPTPGVLELHQVCR